MTRVVHVLVLVCVLACTKTSTNALPPEAWGTEDYVRAGLPPLDRPWTVDDHATAVTRLAQAVAGHPARLPRRDGRSAAVFARLVDRSADADADSDVRARFGVHVQRFEAANQLSKLYVTSELAPPNVEWLAIAGLLLHESQVLARDAEPFLASFGPDDPAAEVRRDGLHKMRQGWTELLQGGLLVLGDARVPEPARITLAHDLRHVLPALYASLEPAQQARLRDQLVRLKGGLAAGPLLAALPAVPGEGP